MNTAKRTVWQYVIPLEQLNLTQFLSGQGFQIQTKRITISHCFRCIHIMITENGHRHQWNAMINAFEHRQKSTMCHKRS